MVISGIICNLTFKAINVQVTVILTFTFYPFSMKYKCSLAYFAVFLYINVKRHKPDKVLSDIVISITCSPYL